MIHNENSVRLPAAALLRSAIRYFYTLLVNAPYDDAKAYVLPDDPDFPTNPEPGFWYIEAEVLELRRMLMLLSSVRNRATLEATGNYADAFRTLIMEYLLIMEADYPAYALLNALRFYSKVVPVTKFQNSSGTTCVYPKGRFREIGTHVQSIVESGAPDDVIQHAMVLAQAFPQPDEDDSGGVFSETLRNAVAHAHFRVDGKSRSGVLLHLTRDYSFLTRTAKKDQITGAYGMCATYTYTGFEKIHGAAVAYGDQADQLFRTFKDKLRNPDFRTLKWRHFQARA